MKPLLTALALAACCLSASCAGGAGTLSPGRDAYWFDGWSGPRIAVFYAAPEQISDATGVVFVAHGVRRNASEYRDAWIDVAQSCDALVLVPRFDAENFPGSLNYNLGGVFNEAGVERPRELWAYSAIEPLFDEAVARFDLTQNRYAIFGHSAGSQFVHRFAMHAAPGRARSLVLANAGWYTMPDPTIAWPYGLGGSAVSEEALRAFLEAGVTVLLGEDDDDPNAEFLRRTPEAIAQGAHRLARGNAFFDAAQAAADARGSQFAWTLQTVPDVGHDNARMAGPAVASLLGEAALDAPSCAAAAGIGPEEGAL